MDADDALNLAFALGLAALIAFSAYSAAACWHYMPGPWFVKLHVCWRPL